MSEWDLFWSRRTTRERLFNLGGITFNRAFAYYISHHIGPPRSVGRILEVGTGRGVCSVTLRKMGYNCVSVDSSEFAVALAKEQGLNTILADGRNLPFSSKTFEVAFTQGLLEHLAVDDQIAILKEMQRVAHKSIHSVPAKYGVMDLGERVFTRLGRKWPYPDEKKYSKSEFIELLSSAFGTIKVRGFLLIVWIGYCQ